MKKLFLIFLFLFVSNYTYSVYASEISLESTQSFYLNQGIVESRTIKVVISNYISDNKSFRLVLPEDANIRFSEDLSFLKITGSGSQKILSGATILPNLREINFHLSEKLINGDSFDINGLKLKVYNKPQGDRYIGIDLTGDSVTEAISVNGYRILDTITYSDILGPSEVFNFTGSIVDSKITLSADMPGDLDFQGIVLENLDSSGKVLSSFFKPNLDRFTYDLQSNYSSIRIKTVDIRANYSTGINYNLDMFKSNIIETNTGTIIPDPVVIEDTILQDPEVDVDVIEKYEPVFKNQARLLNKVVKFIDDYVAKKIVISNSNEINIMIARNKIVVELEKLDTATKEQKVNILINIKTYFKELANLLK
ncbi:MAG: hypothetical protein Q8K30_04830 [Candidatus Gracilibacteria bacterium]|nr:hypothetical protein [Candidatus Gracilibacteria bacterium]